MHAVASVGYEGERQHQTKAGGEHQRRESKHQRRGGGQQSAKREQNTREEAALKPPDQWNRMPCRSIVNKRPTRDTNLARRLEYNGDDSATF